MIYNLFLLSHNTCYYKNNDGYNKLIISVHLLKNEHILMQLHNCISHILSSQITPKQQSTLEPNGTIFSLRNTVSHIKLCVSLV